MKEGVIKFSCSWIRESPLPKEDIANLNSWRDRLYQKGLIGKNEEGIGYGNISCRYDRNVFIITGSGTGSLNKLDTKHYTKVTAWNFIENSLTTAGPVKASSESLTHAAIYESCEEMNAVFHVHHFTLWKKLLAQGAATSNEIEYGTPAMAAEIIRLMGDPQLRKQRILAMGGHEEGILAFGKNEDDAGDVILKWLDGPPKGISQF